MDWANERYVRIYTRDSITVALWSWEARALFWELLRKLDRAGVLDLGGHGPRGLAAAIHVPLDVAERVLAEWLAAPDPAAEMRGEWLVVPAHLAAQEAIASDRERQRRAREARRDLGADVTPRDSESRNVTDGHETNEIVTRGHAVSRGVTPCCAVPSRADPDLSSVVQPTGGGGSPAEAAASAGVFQVWEAFLARRATVIQGRAPKLTRRTRTRIRARLATYSVVDLEKAAAVLFAPGSFWLAEGHTTPEYVFRSDDQVEKLLAREQRGNGNTNGPAAPPGYRGKLDPRTASVEDLAAEGAERTEAFMLRAKGMT